MIILCAYNICDYSLGELFENLPQCFYSYEKEKIKRYRKKNDQKRSLVGKIALPKIILKSLDIEEYDLVFERDTFDRPFLKKPYLENFDFNIAHSGEYVLVGINTNGKIGVDVEKVKLVDLEIVKDVFTAQEIKYVNLNEKLTLKNFYKIWTLKESFVKAIGEGLSYPLKKFYFEFQGNKIIHRIKRIESTWNFSSFNIDSGYQVAVCSNKPNIPNKIEYLKLF